MPTGRFQALVVGDGLTGTDLGDGSIELAAVPVAASDPATDTQVWMPLFDADGALVLDGDGGLIPTLIPIA